MRRYGAGALAAMLCGAFSSLYFFSVRAEVTVSALVLQYSFSETYFTITYLVEMTLRMLPLFVFQILYSTAIYRHFCTASVYYFTRRTNRVAWFLREALGLYPVAVVYMLVMMAAGAGVAACANPIVVDPAGLPLLAYQVAIYALWLCAVTLAMNLFAMKLGSAAGFSVVAAMQLFCIALLNLRNRALPLEFVEDAALLLRNGRLLQLNPIAHLVLSWHSSRIPAVNGVINQFDIEFDLNVSLIAFAALNLLVLAVGCAVVKRHDLLVANAETGGN